METERQQRRRRREIVWVTGVVAYTLVRFLVAYGTLNRYGVNVWIFGLLDVGTAVPYAVATARVVTSLIDRRLRSVSGWAFVASGSFLAPYLYVAFAGGAKGLDTTVWVVLVLLVFCLGTNAVWGIIRKVRAGRTVLPPTAVGAQTF